MNLTKMFSFLVIGVTGSILTFMPAAAEENMQSLSEGQKMEEVRKYFKSEYQEEDYFRTDRLLLTATRHLMQVNEAPAIASVVTGDEIRNMGARNLLDVLERQPGFGITRNYYSVYEIEIRGLKSIRNNRVKLMVDGHVLNYPTMGDGAWAWDTISLETVKRVEVIRGPGSALYGANAYSGMVNVVTQNGGDIDGTVVSAGTGSNDLWRVNIHHGREYGKVDVLASLTYYDIDSADLFVKSDAIGQSGETDDWAESWDGSLKISWKDFVLSSRYTKRDNGPYIGVTNVLNDDSELETEQYMADLSYSRELNDQWTINARGYWDRVDVTFNWEIFPEGFITLPPGMVPPPPLTIDDFTFPDGVLGTPHFKDDTYGVELGAVFRPTENNTITAGVSYEELDHDDVTHHANFDPNTGINLGSYQDITSWANWSKDLTRKTKAAYIQDEWQLLENVRLTAGVRYDDYDDVGDSTNPRLALVWNFHEKADIKLLYGQAFRVPTLDELYSINNPAAVGNPDLKPEEMESFEAGLMCRPLNGMEINVSTFYNEITDMIQLAPTGIPGMFEYQNMGDATVYGVEADLRYYWQKENEFYVNSTWQQPEDDEINRDLPDVPKFRSNLGMNMRLTRNLNSNFNIHYVGERDRAAGDSRSAADDYFKVDATVIIDNFWKALEIRGSVYNVFDEDYSYPATPGTLVNDYPAWDRTYFLEARFIF